LPLAHSALPVQVVKQLAPLHRKAPHDATIEPVQLPLPSQAPALVCIPPAHDAVTQAVPDAQSLHAPPSHVPTLPQVAAAVVPQMPRGSVVPLVALAHVPFVPPVCSAEHA
jgi:hypothetical protein